MKGKEANMFMWITFILFVFNGFAWVLSLAFRHGYYHETDTVSVRAYFIIKGCFWIGLVLMFIFLLLAVKYD